MKAVRVHRFGGPEVLTYEDAPDVRPGPGEAVIRIEAIGVNFIDTYHRSGLYPLETPFIPGSEAAGVVTAVADDVDEVRVGDRVAHAMARGSYAEMQSVPAWRLAPAPDGVDAKTAAALMLQGMTAHYLSSSVFPLEAGHTVLVHAAAGGVGLLLVQLARRRGATVYGTTSTEEKAALAREAGADHVILYTRQDFEAEIKRLTGGRGVDVVYDSVGQPTFEGSLNSLRPRGLLVSFGQSGGAIEPFSPLLLSSKGSLYLTRPTLVHYTLTRAEMLERARDLFAWRAAGDLKIRIGGVFPLAEAAAAHRQLEGRSTSGKLLLIP